MKEGMEPLRSGSAWGARATRRDGLPLGTAPALGSLRKLSVGLESSNGDMDFPRGSDTKRWRR